MNSGLELYADADFAADKTRASTTGYLLRYHGNVIHWASRRQSSIAENSAEAELRSLNEGAHDALFVSRLEYELFGHTTLPILAYEDNFATYQQCVSAVSKSRLKFVELNLFKVNEYVKEGLFKLKLVGTREQLADFLTKPLAQNAFLPLRKQILTTI